MSAPAASRASKRAHAFSSIIMHTHPIFTRQPPPPSNALMGGCASLTHTNILPTLDHNNY